LPNRWDTQYIYVVGTLYYVVFSIEVHKQAVSLDNLKENANINPSIPINLWIFREFLLLGTLPGDQINQQQTLPAY
jgi:hypothetical protein